MINGISIELFLLKRRFWSNLLWKALKINEYSKPFRRRHRKLAFEVPQAEWLAKSYRFLLALSRISAMIFLICLYFFSPSEKKQLT